MNGTTKKTGLFNIAEVVALAETMYTAAVQKGVQTALLVITDGKLLFQLLPNMFVLQDQQITIMIVSDRIALLGQEEQNQETELCDKATSEHFNVENADMFEKAFMVVNDTMVE